LSARIQHRPYCRWPSAHRPAVNADGTSLGSAGSQQLTIVWLAWTCNVPRCTSQSRSFESGGCGTSQDATRFFEQQLASAAVKLCPCGLTDSPETPPRAEKAWLAADREGLRWRGACVDPAKIIALSYAVGARCGTRVNCRAVTGSCGLMTQPKV
jgi:hypothetical protein